MVPDMSESVLVVDGSVEPLELAVVVAEPAPVSSLSSSAGQAVRLRPMSIARAVRTTAPRSLRTRFPHCGHADSSART